MESKQQDPLPPPPPVLLPPPTPREDETLQILDLENLDMTLTTSNIEKMSKEFSCYTTDLSSVNEMDMGFVDSVFESSKRESSRFELSRLELSKRQSSKYEFSKFELSRLELSKNETSISEILKQEMPKYESSIIEVIEKEPVDREPSVCEVVPVEMSKLELFEREITKHESSPLPEMFKNELFSNKAPESEIVFTKFDISNDEFSEKSVVEVPKEGRVTPIIDSHEKELSKNEEEADDEIFSLNEEPSKQESFITERFKNTSSGPRESDSDPDLIEFATPVRPQDSMVTPSPFTFMINKFSKLALYTPPNSTPNKPWNPQSKNLMTPFNNPNSPIEEDVSSIDLIQFSLDESKFESSIQSAKNAP